MLTVSLLIGVVPSLVSTPTHAKAADKQPPILLPIPPKANPPPRPDEKTQQKWQQDRAEKRNQQKAREKPATPTPTEQRNQSLINESKKPRERGFALELAWLATGVNVTDERRDYTSNLTVHFHAFWRKGGKAKDGQIGPFYGLRIAPFSGTGIYKDVPGNYGFVYYGPMVGVGFLSRPRGHYENVAGRRDDQKPAMDSVRGWLLSTGIALQTRTGHFDANGDAEVDDDFTEKGAAFDKPGVWFEARFLQFYFGAVSLSGVAGIQAGNGKTFGYAGIGTGGWR